MNSVVYRAGLSLILMMLVVLAIFNSACSSSAKSGELTANQSPIILSLEAKYMYVDPLGNTEIKCVASAPEGDKVSYKWSSTAGSFIGDGSTVTWQAPKDYGDYHIMVIVTDSNGGSTKSTLTIGVVARPAPKSCCGR